MARDLWFDFTIKLSIYAVSPYILPFFKYALRNYVIHLLVVPETTRDILLT